MRKYLVLLTVCIYSLFTNAQKVGIGTSNPQNKLHVAGGFRLDTLTGVGGAGLVRHDANGVVYGIKFSGNTNDVLRGDGTFGSFSAGGGTNFWSANGTHIYNNNTGNVGIGTTTPGSGLELKGPGLGSQQRITDPVSGNSLVLQGGNGINTKISGYNYTTGVGKNLYLSTDGGNTIINPTAGSVGIGRLAISPGYLLDVGGPVKSVDGLSTHFVAQTTGGTNSWARYYMRSNSQSWFMGTSENFNGNQLYIGDETNNQTRFSIQPAGGPISMQGNVTQNLGAYGLPKAMVYLNGDGTMTRCYNGLTGLSTCDGFSSERSGVGVSGWYYVHFPFDISSCFFSISVENISLPVSVSYQRTTPGNNTLAIVTRLPDGERTDRPVMIIVY